MIGDLSGLSGGAPRAAGLLAFAFASLGLPGLSGFVGEFLSLLGAWKSAIPAGWVVVAAVGVLLAAAYTLWMMQRVVLGTPSKAVAGMSDLTVREIGVLVPLVALTLLVGLWWDSLLRYVDPAVQVLVTALTGA
jgi:NADH-quinone oxidoreductase subunit M